MSVFNRLKWLFFGGDIRQDNPVTAALAEQLYDHTNKLDDQQKALWRVEQKLNRHLNTEIVDDLQEHLKRQPEPQAETMPPLKSGTELTPEMIAKLNL